MGFLGTCRPFLGRNGSEGSGGNTEDYDRRHPGRYGSDDDGDCGNTVSYAGRERGKCACGSLRGGGKRIS